MAVIAFAMPVLPGRSERVAGFGKELEPLRDEFEQLNRRATISRQLMFLQRTPMGDVIVNVWEIDDPAKVDREFTDSAYDRWFVDFSKDVVGLDPRGPSDLELPELIFSWSA